MRPSIRSTASGADDRAECRRALAWVGRQESPRALREFPGEEVGHRLVDDDALGRHANLALIHESAEGCGLGGLLQIRIIQHHEGCFAAQFEQAGL